MPAVSSKGIKMPESPIRKLVPFAEKAYKQNKTVYHLNIGQPDIKSPQIAMDAVVNHNLEILAYTRSEGSEGYRNKIAAYYHKNHKWNQWNKPYKIKTYKCTYRTIYRIFFIFN